jgi:geranylgeranylglycerol-phosphate geranylgeranyltransferase
MFRTRILGLFRLFRFELPFTAGVCVILGELLALGKFPTTTEIVLGFLRACLKIQPDLTIGIGLHI